VTPFEPLDVSRVTGSDFPASLCDQLAREGSFVVGTSGSTGYPTPVVLTSGALLASAHAAYEALGGPGQWLSALSPTHIGGLQVWVRSFISGLDPVQMAPDAPFTSEAFASAAERMRSGQRRYVSLVPTQIHRLLATAAGATALASFDRVLIGGAGLAPSTASALTDAGVFWTHTYGMTETSGGCVYDGIPLRDVRLRTDGPIGEPGRILIAGPTLAQRYAGRTDLTADAFVRLEGQTWFKTGDIGIRLAPEPGKTVGRWRIVGRSDDVINTGGHKVHPQSVVDALTALDEVSEASVVGVPDAEWGMRVAAMVVESATTTDTSSLRADPTTWSRSRLRPSLQTYALPAQVTLATDLPRLPSGKVDTAGVRAAFVQEDGRI